MTTKEKLVSYVQETPHNTNPNVVASFADKLLEESGSGSGLPDPTDFENGTILVVKDGEWVKQGGYGYESEPAFEPIEWDGNTEGRTHFASYYKVSDTVIPSENIIGAKVEGYINGKHVTLTIDSVDTSVEGLYTDGSGMIYVVYGAPIENPYLGLIPENGIYFYCYQGSYIAYLAAPSPVTTIDPKFIPQSGTDEFVVKFNIDYDPNVATSDKTWDEIVNALANGKMLRAGVFMDGMYMGEAQFKQSAFVYSWIVPSSNVANYMIFNYDGASTWAFETKSYTLTPASTD